jgi:hypothetical protein
MEQNAHGWKTYATAILTIGYGGVQISQGNVNEGIALILAGLALIGLRGAFAKLIQS